MGRRTDEQRAKHRLEQQRYREKHPERVKESQKKYVNKCKKLGKKYWSVNYETRNERRRERNAESIENCDKFLYKAKWSDEEVKYLIDNYQTKTIPELSALMGRTEMSIERKRNRLGLKKER